MLNSMNVHSKMSNGSKDSELCFDKKRPAEYMCSLFRLQNRFRKGDYVTKQQVKKLLPLLDEKAELLPIVRISLHMTHLLLNPCWGSAWHVLYVSFKLAPLLCHFLTFSQRSCGQSRRHTRLCDAALGLSSRHRADPEHSQHLRRQPYPAIL